jgi:type II secretory pathway component PulL
MAQRIVALEIDGEFVRAAVAERVWNNFILTAVCEQKRHEDEPDLTAALQRLIAKTGTPNILISALPGEFVARRLLELPFSDRRKLQQVVPFALEEHLPFPVDDAVVTFARVGRNGDNSIVMTAYARKEDVQHHLEILARAGLDPKAVTLGSFALASMMGRLRNGHHSSHLIVNFDHRSTSLILLDSVGTPRAMRTIGGETVGHNGAIVNSARQMLLAHSHEAENAELILSGSTNLTARIRSQFAEGLSLPIRDAADLDFGAIFGSVPPGAARFGTCLAMLMGEMPTYPAEMLNFRQGELAFRGRTSDLAPLKVPALLIIGVLALASIHFFMGVSANLARLANLNRQLVAAAEPAVGKIPAAQVPIALRSGITEMRKQLRLLGTNPGQTSPLDVLLAVSQALPPGLSVEITDLSYDDTGLRLTGQAASFAAVDQAKMALMRSGRFANVEAAGKASSDGGKVDFRLTATVPESAGGFD